MLASLRFWEVQLEHQAVLLLGPLAVQPNLRGQGYGVQIVAEGLRARRLWTNGHWCWCLANQNIIQNLVLFQRRLIS